MAIVGTISAENGTLTSTLSDSDLLNPTRNGSYSDDYQLTDVTTGQIITAKLTSDDIDSYLQLIDADTGEMVTEDDNSSSNNINSQLRFKALEGVNYIVRVSSYRKGEEGTYQLTTRSDAPPTPVGTISAANGSVTGSLSNEDSYDPTDYRNYYIDDYQLTDAIPGEVVTLQMNAINLNGRIQLIDADTEKIIKEKSAYGQQTVDLSFVAVTDKNYKVRVSSANEGQTGSYQLNATSTAMNLADLAITESSAPAEITSGEEVAVTWTVANLGDADTTSTSWYDAIYLSRNTTFDPDKDSFLAFVNKSPVVKGDSQSFSRNIAISGYALERANEINNNTNPLEGDWYLLFVTDAFDDQLERDETNNVVAHQIQVNATDLAITNVEAPNSASVGDPISLSWTVKNSGDISAFGYWGDEIYLSDDEYFSGDDEYLEYGEREDYTVPLAAGESYTISLETALGNTKNWISLSIIQDRYL